tara:strand:- start:20 stop:652 length:633 start_codon:yes stop_codon:yes gene_type:complete
MDTKVIYNNYLNTLYSNIIENDNIEKISFTNDCILLEHFFYESKYIEFIQCFELYNENNEKCKTIALYKIQKLYFIIILPYNLINLTKIVDNTIFNYILQKNKILFFDNIDYFFRTKLDKDHYNQIKNKINNNNSELETIDETNINIIMNQTTYNKETATELYYKYNKNIENVIKYYINPEIKNDEIEDLSVNQMIYKEIGQFFDNSHKD